MTNRSSTKKYLIRITERVNKKRPAKRQLKNIEYKILIPKDYQFLFGSQSRQLDPLSEFGDLKLIA